MHIKLQDILAQYSVPTFKENWLKRLINTRLFSIFPSLIFVYNDPFFGYFAASIESRAIVEHAVIQSNANWGRLA